MVYRKNAFTMAEVLISLLMVCLATTAIGSALSATIRVDKARDTNVAIKAQNISVVENLRDSVKSSDDMWRLFDTYNCEILDYTAETSAKVLAVERGTVDPLVPSLIWQYNEATYNKNISINGKSFGSGVELTKSGSKVIIKSDSLDNYKMAVVGIACNPGETGCYKIKSKNVENTKYISGDTDNTALELIHLEDNDSITITNLTDNELYVTNTYFVQDSAVMGYEEENNIVSALKDDTVNNYPTLFRVEVSTQIKGKKDGNGNISEDLGDKYNKNNNVVTFIILKE